MHIIHKPNMGKVGVLFVVQMLLLLITCSFIRSDDSNSTGCVEEERQALLSLKHSFGGPFVHRLRSWRGRDCCVWDGIRCDKSTGRVLLLDLRAPLVNDLGSIFFYDGRESLEAKEVNPSLMKLKYLKYLDLSGNHFSRRSIPELLGEMKGLTYLNLSSAYFGGRVPIHLGNLSDLVFLDLSESNYMLYADDLSWVSSLSSLQHLDMGDVYLNKVVPKLMLQQVLTQLSSLLHLGLSHCGLNDTYLFTTHPSTNSTLHPPTLRHLDLSHNFFHGPLPDFIQNITSLELLDLSSNFLNCSIPLWLGNLNKLDSLHLNFNELNSPGGEMSLILRNLSNLHSLDLSGNRFNGIIPASIGRSVPSLIYLDLSMNQFRGIIPASMGGLISLSILDMSYNQFNGTIPTLLWRLSSLTHLDLSYNNLNDTISTSLGQLSNLVTLDLSHNELYGIIPESLGKLVNLRWLDLNSNGLEGVISSKYHLANLSSLEDFIIDNNHLITLQIEPNWTPPFQLDYLSLSSCRFEPRLFPTWLRTQNQLSYLDISNTSISDTFPVWLLEDNPVLNYLDLSYNQITGPLPSHVKNVSKRLYLVIMTENMLNGSIPNWFCNIKINGMLDLSKNNFSGDIPNCLMNHQNLEVINLSSNKLSGIIPTSFHNMPSLRWLSLSSNNLIGSIPQGLRKVSLVALDLGDNRLSGKIPAWIGESFPSLKILKLRNNTFNGIIPPRLCLLSLLRIMDLANNELAGMLPSCLGNITAMADVSVMEMGGLVNLVKEWRTSNMRQELKGEELEYTSVLPLLINMDLSGNKLVGSIPQELTKLIGLIGLNLARNQLSGCIPKNIRNLKSLISLDLSHNQLSGQIPDTLSALKHLSYLNLSTNNLVGKIPQGNQLQTLDDPSIYEGNPQLCGLPLPQTCPENDPISNGLGGEGINEDKDSALEKMWFYIIVMAGYATGFWAVVGVLIVKKNWRHAYFRYVDEIKDGVYVAVAVKMRVLKKKMKKMETGQPQ